MKIIRINRKAALVGLILLLIILAICIFNIISPVISAFRNGYEHLQLERDIYKTYTALNGDFVFQLPEQWTTWSETFGGNEITYHLYFKSNDTDLHGFVQVWNISKPLKIFLEESKKSAVGVVNFKYFNIKEIMENNRKGYLVEYSRANESGKYIKSYEVFLEGSDNKVYRISFFSPESDWKNYYPNIFEKIIKTFNIKN